MLFYVGFGIVHGEALGASWPMGVRLGCADVDLLDDGCVEIVLLCRR